MAKPKFGIGERVNKSGYEFVVTGIDPTYPNYRNLRGASGQGTTFESIDFLKPWVEPAKKKRK